MSFQALSARLADPAPAFLCEGLVDGSEILVRVEHLVGAPTTTSELDTFRRLLRGVAPDLLEVWARWNGVRLYAEPDVAEPNHLVARHPVDEMEDWTLAMRECWTSTIQKTRPTAQRSRQLSSSGHRRCL